MISSWIISGVPRMIHTQKRLKYCRGLKRDYVMKGEFGWSDVGTWHSFHEISPKDENNNVSNSEQVRLIETKECIINVPQDKKVIIEGIENCIIVENNDILMICHRDHEDNIRHFDDMLKHTTKELN